MKVLLIRDVYKLGRAGDIKKVADGYGRNFLLPQGFAVLATEGARKQVEIIKAKATARRAALNEEMSSVAEVLTKTEIHFTGKSGETGKLYGSVTTQMIADAIKAKSGVEVARRQIDSQPLRVLGEYKVHIRLTVDLIPTIDVIVYREGEAVNVPVPTKAAAPAVEETVEEPEPATETEVETEVETETE